MEHKTTKFKKFTHLRRDREENDNWLKSKIIGVLGIFTFIVLGIFIFSNAVLATTPIMDTDIGNDVFYGNLNHVEQEVTVPSGVTNINGAWIHNRDYGAPNKIKFCITLEHKEGNYSGGDTLVCKVVDNVKWGTTIMLDKPFPVNEGEKYYLHFIGRDQNDLIFKPFEAYFNLDNPLDGNVYLYHSTGVFQSFIDRDLKMIVYTDENWPPPPPVEHEDILEFYQNIPTNGFPEAEYFEINGDKYLAVVNFATKNIKIYQWENLFFNEIQNIPYLNNVYSCESFKINEETYLAIAIVGGVDSVIYKWNGTNFEEFQFISIKEVYDWESFQIDGETYIVGAENGSDVNVLYYSKIYKWNGINFEEFQYISSLEHQGELIYNYGCESFKINGETYLAIANFRDWNTMEINSYIFKWDGSAFMEIQAIPTNGAFGFRSFIINNETYVMALNYGGTDSVIYKAILSNSSPLANAGMDQFVVRGDLVILDGGGSSDPDENYPLSYSWDIVSRPIDSTAVLFGENTVSPTFIADLPGDYVVRLTVTDSLGLVSDYDEVLVSTFNTPPIADAGEDQSVIQIGALIQLDGSQSYDEEGDNINYLWTFVNKPVGSMAVLSDVTAVNPTFTADIQGEYIIELTTSDTWSTGNPDQVIITFENVVPVANAGVNQSVLEGDIVYLDGSGSLDANLDSLTYSWGIISKSDSSLAEINESTYIQTSFVADMSGQYIISLTVNDGFTDSEPSNVTVVAISYQDAVTDTLQEIIIEINELDLSVLKNKDMQNALTNKINSVLAKIDDGLYWEALDHLQNDILKKTNGCTEIGEPDNNDWIRDCVSQRKIYPLIIEVIGLLETLI